MYFLNENYMYPTFQIKLTSDRICNPCDNPKLLSIYMDVLKFYHFSISCPHPCTLTLFTLPINLKPVQINPLFPKQLSVSCQANRLMHPCPWLKKQWTKLAFYTYYFTLPPTLGTSYSVRSSINLIYYLDPTFNSSTRESPICLDSTFCIFILRK